MGFCEPTTSDHPTLAPPDFASMPPVLAIDSWTWQGSGFRPRDVLGGRFFLEDEMSACAGCGSLDVRCIFLHCFHHVVESDVRVELACNACGTFTVHAYERL